MERTVKILVISDTHGNYPLAIKALDKVGSVEMIIHLGDGLDDAMVMEEVACAPVVKVAGNCDFSTSIPEELTFSAGGETFFITHGHRYAVKSGLNRLCSKAMQKQSSIVLYGHTHFADIQTHNEVLLVNPGCLAQNCPDKTCAVVTISAGEISARIVEID